MRMMIKDARGVEAPFRDFRRIGWGEGVENLWYAYDEEIRSMPSIADRELWIRAPEQALRVATVVAVFDGSPAVSLRHWQWSVALVDQSMQQLQRALRKGMSEDLAQIDLVDLLREEFIHRGSLTEGQINKHCERKTNDFRKIAIAIEHLIKVGDIVELNQIGKVGRPTRKWQWQGLAKEKS